MRSSELLSKSLLVGLVVATHLSPISSKGDHGLRVMGRSEQALQESPSVSPTLAPTAGSESVDTVLIAYIGGVALAVLIFLAMYFYPGPYIWDNQTIPEEVEAKDTQRDDTVVVKRDGVVGESQEVSL